MTTFSYLFGHQIYFDKEWKYYDNKEPVELSKRNCGNCGLPRTKEDHDGCLGILKHAMNACCGHGKSKEAYFQFWNGFCLRGIPAIVFIKTLKLNRLSFKGKNGINTTQLL